MAYVTTILRTDADLRSLREEWQELYGETRPRNPFLSPEWIATCRAHACPDVGLVLVTARRAGRLVAVAPLCEERRHGFRVLRHLGSGWSEYGGFLCAPEHPGAESALLEELGSRRHDWDLLLLRQLAPEFSGLPGAAMPEAMASRTLTADGAPYLAFPGDWDALRKDGPGWLRQAPKRVRRFERDGGTVERMTGEAAAAAMDAVAAVEARSWQARHGQPVFLNSRTRDMFRRAFRDLERRGEFELWLARMNGEAVAYEINVLPPDRLWLYRGGYDPTYARYGPGTVLEYLSIRHAWEAGRREYDYLSGCEPYKTERTDAVRPLLVLSAHPDTLRGRLAFALLVAPRARLREHRGGAKALAFLARARRCPQALLPWNAALRDRVF